MSRAAKWKIEKTKVKVVFRLQFHATHIPQAGWDKLFISFIPSDSGKATAKTTKANVRNGTCKWADPIYETTRLLQDAKSKQYDEKLYKLVVAMGSSRASVLGETTINLTDYADALKPSAVSLPLHGCTSGTVLHVTVQLLTSKTGFREFEQQREQRERGLQSGAESKHDDSSLGKEAARDQLNKVNARVRFKDATDLASFEAEVGSHEEYAASTLGFDDSSNTSESLYAEKHDDSSVHESDSLRSNASGDLNRLPHCQGPQPPKGDVSNNPLMVQCTSDSIHRWPSNSSVDDDLAMVYEENYKLKGSLELAESTIIELKHEISSLQSQANELSTETKKFSYCLASEISSSEETAKEISLLKSECLKFKDDIEKLQNFKIYLQGTGDEDSHTEHHQLFQNRQLRWENEILYLENRIKKLQQKAYLGFRERDIMFFHSELEELLGILKGIKNETGIAQIRGTCLSKSEQSPSGTELDLDLALPESLLHHFSIPPLISQETDYTGVIDVMKKKIFDLTRELGEAKAERENLARKMDQMECYYETLIQELEENQKQMLGEYQNLRNEHSTCFYTICSSKAEMESMRQDMSQQLLQLAEERRDLDCHNKELERRAITSEAALRRARLNYSIAVDKLQKDLELLSLQVVSMFETNENLIKQAFPESPQTQAESASLMQCQIPNAGVKNPPLGGEIVLKDFKQSLYLQNELYQKVKGELHEVQLVNLDLDIFSTTLQETLREANAQIEHMKGNIDELAEQLELSNITQDQLIISLQTAMEDICLLNDMARENQTLGAKLEILTTENSLLIHKVADFEAIMSRDRRYQKKYEACCAEKAELLNALQHKTTENVELQNENFFLKEELETSKGELDELVIVKDNLQENVSFVQDKLEKMLISYDQQFKGLNLLNYSHFLDLEVNNLQILTLELEKMQHNACNKIFELTEEKTNLVAERVSTATSLSAARSDVLDIKQKFKSDIQKMAAKLDMSNGLVVKLQFDLESVADKFHLGSEMEEKYAQQSNELLADHALFEAELHNLTSKHALLVREISGLEDLTEELRARETAIGDLTQEKQGLVQESIKLASECDRLTEYARSIEDQLEVERNINDNLEGMVKDLTSQLNLMQEKLLKYEQQQAELVHFRQLSSDLELEKSRLTRVLLLREECLEKLREESSCMNHLQTQLLEMDDDILAADVKFTFLLNLFFQCVEYSDGCLEELQKRHHEVEAALHQSFSSEERYREENLILKMNVESLHSNLEASVAENKFSSDAIDVIIVQLEEHIKDKEQYETRVEELKQQLFISKKHGEELLSKLQDEIDEVQNRRKSEALQLERIEELSLKIVEFEADLQSALSEKYEKARIYERVNAELESAVLTLECCKEEKVKLEVSLRECGEEKNKIAIELTRTKEHLENVASSRKFHKEENGDGEDSLVKGQDVQKATTKYFRGVNEDTLLGGVVEKADEKPSDISNTHLDNISLRSSMEHLHLELERMKNENSLLPSDHQIDPDFQVLQAELMRLHSANEELKNIFPLFDEISSRGNALERVLALEIELAESLRAKSKSNIHFQSSFVKQHSDEEAILKSFRDIHELIKEMVELKGSYAALETELKEMHNRYSQLSLQFAEVEGERQKLKMTLKNVRASRKLYLNRSSSAADADWSPKHVLTTTVNIVNLNSSTKLSFVNNERGQPGF